jgi:hypothetical protein
VGGAVSDEALTLQALAANPDLDVAEDAVSLWELSGGDGRALLPDWYMPSPMPGVRRVTGWRRRVILAVVMAFVLINAAGLCSTYGAIVVA